MVPVDDDDLTSIDGGIRVDDVTIVLLLLLEVETEWGFGAVVVLIVFDVDDDKEGTNVLERLVLL